MKIYKTFPDGMQIVEYDDTLAQLVADMWNKSREGWGGGSDIRTADQVVGEHAGGSFFNVFLALKDGEIIGYCSYDRYYKDGDTAYVHCLNVRPDFHGHKVGKALVLMCVNETIARGMPRVDIHTWPGNTKAVPLYKKCGFLWEDRADTTHLSNYIPTVLETELFKDFFAKADWYADSTRVIEIRPDGVKSDNFEFAGYQWEKDGERLSVGFEKTGRRVRRAETDDYLIEMTADNHELAFGFGYNCKFRVVNKTGKPLDIAITGKSDGVIDFTGQWEAAVAGEAEFTGDFFVNAIPEEQDIWRMHPCVLADVTVNGKHAEFGLGIEPKFPLTVKLTEKRLAAKPGMTEDLYINVKNSLPESGTVRFALPDNALTDFGQKSYEIRLEKGNDAMIETKAVIKACGYEALPVAYEIELDGGRKTGFTRALHLVNQGLEGQFAYENDAEYGAANGQWRLRLNKLNNGVDYERIVPPGHGYFWGYSLGKPFSDEFNITKPSDVRVAIDGAFVKMEADFESQKFSGALLTEIFEMDAAGTLKLSHRVTNRSAQARELFVKANICTNVGRRVVFHYDGQFHEISDELHYGFSDISPEKIDENWMFDYSAGNPAGVYWPAKYKPYTKWGDVFQFEYAAGELAPGESFETEPIVYMLGVFGSFVDFRNFVLGINEEIAPYTHNHLEILTNGGNPVVSGERLTLALVNHRQKVWPGTVSVSSPDGLFAEETQENTEDVIREENSFTVPLAPGKTGIQEARVSVRFQSYEKDNTRAVLIPDRSAQIFSGEKDGVFTVTNGALSFSAAPAYADAAYSLKYGENEWFFSKYPKAAPHSWWNPFVGGLCTRFWNLSSSEALREKITAGFAEETDALGNRWTGIRTDLHIEKFDEYRGMVMSQYYLTIPGVPVMCYFARIYNGTGIYQDIGTSATMFVAGKEGLSDLYVSLTSDERVGYRRRFGGDIYTGFDRLAVLSREGAAQRPEKLYVFRDAARDKGKNALAGDINAARFDMEGKVAVKPGDSFAMRPVFCLLMEKALTLEALADLERVYFS